MPFMSRIRTVLPVERDPPRVALDGQLAGRRRPGRLGAGTRRCAAERRRERRPVRRPSASRGAAHRGGVARSARPSLSGNSPGSTVIAVDRGTAANRTAACSCPTEVLGDGGRGAQGDGDLAERAAAGGEVDGLAPAGPRCRPAVADDAPRPRPPCAASRPSTTAGPSPPSRRRPWSSERLRPRRPILRARQVAADEVGEHDDEHVVVVLGRGGGRRPAAPERPVAVDRRGRARRPRRPAPRAPSMRSRRARRPPGTVRSARRRRPGRRPASPGPTPGRRAPPRPPRRRGRRRRRPPTGRRRRCGRRSPPRWPARPNTSARHGASAAGPAGAHPLAERPHLEGPTLVDGGEHRQQQPVRPLGRGVALQAQLGSPHQVGELPARRAEQGRVPALQGGGDDLVGDGDHRVDEPLLDVGGRAGPRQRVGGVLAEQLQQPVGRPGHARLGGDQRALDERAEHVERRRRDPVAGDGGGEAEVEGAGEDPEQVEDPALTFVEQPGGDLDRRPHRVVAIAAPVGAPQQVEALIDDAPADRRDRSPGRGRRPARWPAAGRRGGGTARSRRPGRRVAHRPPPPARRTARRPAPQAAGRGRGAARRRGRSAPGCWR